MKMIKQINILMISFPMISIFLFSCIFKCAFGINDNSSSNVRTLQIPLAAVQNQNQIFFSYIPYISDCYYNDSTFIPGQLIVTNLNSATFFEMIQYESMISYSALIKNGLNIAILLEDYINQKNTEFNGFIFYNSKIVNFTRNLILFSANEGNLTFYYGYPTIQLSNLTINISITEVVFIPLSQNASFLLQECEKSTNITNSNFAYLGLNQFIFVCGQLESGFIFSPSWSENQTIILDLTQIGIGQYNVTTNPSILRDHSSTRNESWNILILAQGSNSTKIFFLDYDFPSNNYSLYNFQEMYPEVIFLVNRLWGEQVVKQFTKWMDLFAQYTISPGQIYFPGDITSVFVNSQDYVYIESQTQNLSYLSVFNDKKTLMWNISYNGSIIFYGNKQIVIFDEENNLLYAIEVRRPVYTLNIDTVQDTTPGTYYNFTVNVTCKDFIIVLNYTIWWTTLEYPTSKIIFLDHTPLYSEEVITGFQFSQYFRMIGPDFRVIPNPTPPISVVQIQNSIFYIKQEATKIVNAVFSGINNIIIMFCTNTSIYSINTKFEVRTVSIQPCGFINIKQVEKNGNGGFYVINRNNQYCNCSFDFQICQAISSLESLTPDLINSQMYEPQSLFLNVFSQLNRNSSLINGISIKKNLFKILNQGYVVSILENNTVLLISFKNKTIFYSITLNCSSYNSTNGEVYYNSFYDPFLIVYCQGTSFLSQYLIRYNQIIYSRTIPLYQFVLHNNSLNFFQASQYFFVSVLPIYNVYPNPDNCCVLRLDPEDYTVSVISQVIQAKQIVDVYTIDSYDIVLLKIEGSSEYKYMIKIYYPTFWITLNQTNSSKILFQQSVPLIFESSYYNFGAAHQINITFNLTGININATKYLQDQINENDLQIAFSQKDNILIGSTEYSLRNYVCGPLFQSYFSKQYSNETNVQIIQKEVIIANKQIGKIGTQFYQIINPQKFGVENLTLNELMIFVSVDTIYFYAKQTADNIQLSEIFSFNLPEKKCLYYLISVVNQTSANLISNCKGIFSKKNPLLLTINYFNSTISYSYEYIPFPLPLNTIVTIVNATQNHQTLVVGMLQGPMSAKTGKLFICTMLLCSQLYASTNTIFLLDFTTQVNGSMYVIMSIDYQMIQIYVNPTVGPKVINSNYSVNYTKYITDIDCSTIHMMQTNEYWAQVLISCSKYYYHALIFYSDSSISIQNKFSRYSQCDSEDLFHPHVIYNSSGLQMIFAECEQNDFTLKLQSYETINSSTPIIFTGYLQIFVMNGPLGPNCTDSISPAKIIPLSIKMQNPLFEGYFIEGPNSTLTYKFLYSFINGIIIDNYVQFQPNIKIQFEPVTITYSYPTVNFHAFNQYSNLGSKIETSLKSAYIVNAWNYLVFSVYIMFNFITICCLGYFCCQKNKNLLSKISRKKQSKQDDQIDYEDNLREVIQTKNSERNNFISIQLTQSQKSKRVSQIQMFFVKSK